MEEKTDHVPPRLSQGHSLLSPELRVGHVTEISHFPAQVEKVPSRDQDKDLATERVFSKETV